MQIRIEFTVHDELPPAWLRLENADIDPRHWHCIQDHSEVISIQASKIVGGPDQWYRIILEGERR